MRDPTTGDELRWAVETWADQLSGDAEPDEVIELAGRAFDLAVAWRRGDPAAVARVSRTIYQVAPGTELGPDDLETIASFAVLSCLELVEMPGRAESAERSRRLREDLEFSEHWDRLAAELGVDDD